MSSYGSHHNNRTNGLTPITWGLGDCRKCQRQTLHREILHRYPCVWHGEHFCRDLQCTDCGMLYNDAYVLPLDEVIGVMVPCEADPAPEASEHWGIVAEGVNPPYKGPDLPFGNK
jgi:hypothetical protein